LNEEPIVFAPGSSRFKIEENSDVHLVIADPGLPKRAMIVEFPATA